MPDLFRLQLFLATFAGWVNRHQAQAIDYLVEENRVLKEQLDGKRIRLTNDQRRRLAAKGKARAIRKLSRTRIALQTRGLRNGSVESMIQATCPISSHFSCSWPRSQAGSTGTKSTSSSTSSKRTES